MRVFSSKPKSYVERNPAAAGAYASLTPAQKKVLDEFSYREHKNLKATDKKAMQRIADEYIIPKGLGRPESQIKELVRSAYQSAIRCLQEAEITTNISSRLFALDEFFNSKDVKTVWTHNTGKGSAYHNNREQVEERAFGFTIDWNVPIKEAAMTRPVYAGLNFTGHPYGAATPYGSVALVYKTDVAQRSTFINADTFDNQFEFATAEGSELEAQRSKICTFAQMGTLVANMSKNQLKALLQMTESTYVFTDYPPNYLEAHVLGGIHWDRDLTEIRVATTGQETLDKEAAVAKRSVATMKYLIADFAKKHGVPARTYSVRSVVEVLN
jgi:hypothetical protein